MEKLLAVVVMSVSMLGVSVAHANEEGGQGAPLAVHGAKEEDRTSRCLGKYADADTARALQRLNLSKDQKGEICETYSHNKRELDAGGVSAAESMGSYARLGRVALTDSARTAIILHSHQEEISLTQAYNEAEFGKTRPLIISGWVLTGVGVASLVSGIVLSTAKFTSTSSSYNSTTVTTKSYGGAGVLMSIIGVAALGAGVPCLSVGYYRKNKWIEEGQLDDPPARTGAKASGATKLALPSVSLGKGHVGVQWGLTF